MIFDDANKGIAQAYLSMLSESHFEVGDKVKCKASGMTGTVTKLDKEDGGEDEKYYTVKQDSGKVMKYAPSELKKLNESMMNEATQKPMRGDSINFDLDGKNVTAMVLSVSGNKAVVRSVKGKHTVDLSKIDYTVVADEATKLDPVNKKAVKKDFDDRGDKDIDNDGDVDDSDEYLHKRRKAISKAMKDEAMEIELPKKSKSNLKDDDDDDGDYDYDDDDDDDDGEAKAKKKKDMKESYFIDENYRKLAQQGIGTESKKSAKTGQMIDFYEPNQGNKKSGKIVKVASDHYVVKDDDGGKEYKFQFYTNKAKLGEDFQRIYELSKDTLTRYSNAAKGQHNDAMDKLRSPVSGSEFRKQSKTMAKRSRGYGAASKRLKNEDYDLSEADKTAVSHKAALQMVHNAGFKSDKEIRDAFDAIKKMKQPTKGYVYANDVDKLISSMDGSVKEDLEQVDELSKKTLGNYIKKASHDVASKGAATRQFANDSRDAKEKENYVSARKSMDMADKVFDKSWKRRGSMAKAVNRLTKEDYEQVDELSKKTLGRYINKANSSSATTGIEAGSAARGGKSYDQESKKLSNRALGVSRAVNRLTKEDAEGVDESSLKDMRAAAERRAGSVMKPKATKPKARPGSMEAMRADAEKRRMREDVEEIDELSTGTLTRYSNAARGQARNSMTKLGSANSSAEVNKHSNTMTKRLRGNAAASKRLNREDVEQVDELSKKTLGSYADKASSDMKKTDKQLGKSVRRGTGDRDELMGKIEKRYQGVEKAKSRIAKEDLEWDWESILEAPEEEIDALIEELSDEEFDSFYSELESLEEGVNMYQASTSDTQPTDITGRETLEPRAQADREFADMHRDSTNVKDYPGKNRQDGTMRMSQAPVRPGEKRNPEPKKTLSDIRRRM